MQQQANRGGVVGGSTFYILDIEDGAVLDSKDVGNDNLRETVDNCVAANDCRKLKNALQADPVATGPNDPRFITKAYIGDLDGKHVALRHRPGRRGRAQDQDTLKL